MTQHHSKEPWFRKSYLCDNLSSLASLQHRCWMSKSQAAEFLGVTLRTYHRWLKGAPPEWARLLMAIRAGYVPWDGWQEWEVTDEGIQAPGYLRRPLTPSEIMSMHFRMQELAQYKRLVRNFNEMADQVEFNQQVLSRHVGSELES